MGGLGDSEARVEDMGSTQSKRRKKKEVVRGLREKVRMLEKEMREMIWIRESENETHQREIMVYSLKERKWRRERKRMREEVKRLRKMLEERERREKYYHDVDDGRKWEWQLVAAGTRHRTEEEEEEEERARRDDAVERWKRLYLAIKVELDALILRTHQGERLHDRSEEELKEKLQRDMRAKEETIELLQAKIASMEQKESKREREVDLLKQSFRILSYNKKLKSLPKGFFQTPAYAKKQLVAI